MKYFSFGSGEKNFVILPGASVRSVMLSADAVAAAYDCFSKDYTVYVFDCPENLREGCTIQYLARETAAAMRELGIENAYVFGCSLGGMTAQFLAAENPDLVHKMVLGSTLARPDEISRANCERWSALAAAGDVLSLNRDVFSHVYSEAYHEQYKDVFTVMETLGEPEELKKFSVIMRACAEMDSSAILDKISCPVLVIGSWDDNTLSPECCVGLARELGCGLYMYSGYGHAVYDEAPDYKAHLMRFFED